MEGINSLAIKVIFHRYIEKGIYMSSIYIFLK